jgi:hypothetical protein
MHVESQKLDVAVAFHVSPSLNPKQLNKVFVAFLENLFTSSELDSGQVKVSLGFFNKNFKILGDLNKYKNKADYAAATGKLPRNVRAPQVNGGVALKNIGRKIFNKKFGDRPDADNVVLIVTDAKVNVKAPLFLKEAQKLHKAGVKIVTVGLEGADMDELRTVASPGDANVLMTRTYDDLTPLAQTIKTAVFTREFAARFSVLQLVSSTLTDFDFLQLVVTLLYACKKCGSFYQVTH